MPNVEDLPKGAVATGTQRPGESPAELARRLKALEDLFLGKGLDVAKIDKPKLLAYIRSNLELEKDQFSPGQTPQSALFQGTSYMRDLGEHAFFFSSGNTNIANTATAAVDMQSTVFDLSSTGLTMHSGTTQWICRRPGMYDCTALGAGAVGGFGFTVAIFQNAANVLAVGPNTINNKEIYRALYCNKGDVVDVRITNSTGALAGFTGWLMIHRTGDSSNDHPTY